MVVYLLFCFDLFLYSIDFIVLTKFMDAQYGDFKRPYIQRALLLTFITISSALLLWNSPFGGTYPFFSVIFSYIILCFYKGNWQKKLLFSLCQLVISGYLVTLVIALLRCFDVNLRYIGINYYITLGGMHLVFWLLILLLRKFSREDSTILPNTLLLVVLAIPISSLLVLVFFIIRTNNNATMLFSLELPLLCVFIFINIMTAFIYSQFCNLLERSNEILLLNQQLKLSEQHFQDLTSVQEKVKCIRHDMKNHLQAVLLMSQQTPLQTQDIQDYIVKLLSDVSKATKTISTGNLGIDSILSIKSSEIKEKQIQLNSKIVIPAGLNITFDDSIIILGNILDNAIQACEKIPLKSRWIRLEITYIQQSVFIRIANPLPPLSEKRSIDNYDEHGLGLKNVESAVRKYHGITNIKRVDDLFEIAIVLYHL